MGGGLTSTGKESGAVETRFPFCVSFDPPVEAAGFKTSRGVECFWTKLNLQS